MEIPMLRLDQVAQVLQVSRPTVYAWIRQGRLRACKAGGALRVRAEDLEAFIYEHSLDYGQSAQKFIQRERTMRRALA
jgi:excisionase family DNA binding protein